MCMCVRSDVCNGYVVVYCVCVVVYYVCVLWCIVCVCVLWCIMCV